MLEATSKIDSHCCPIPHTTKLKFQIYKHLHHDDTQDCGGVTQRFIAEALTSRKLLLKSMNYMQGYMLPPA